MFLEHKLSILEWFLKGFYNTVVLLHYFLNKCSLGEHKRLLKMFKYNLIWIYKYPWLGITGLNRSENVKNEYSESINVMFW